MQITHVLALGLTACLLSACSTPTHQSEPETASSALTYPAAARSDHTDDYFDETVADPYRWMEDLNSSEVAAFIEAQNEIAIPYLEAIPTRERVTRRIDELWSFERYRVPVSEGGSYFYHHNDGTQDQDVLYVTEDLSVEARVLIDPNTFSDDATIALSTFSVSPDGTLVAYSTSDGGSDWKTWHVRDVSSGEDLADLIEGTKFTRVSWDRDSAGFYYSRYPWVVGGAEGEANDDLQVKIYHHDIGDPQSSDELIYEITDHDTQNPMAQLTEDGRYLIIGVFDGYSANGLYYRDMNDPSGEVVRLFNDWEVVLLPWQRWQPLLYLRHSSCAQRKSGKYRCVGPKRRSHRGCARTGGSAGISQLHRRPHRHDLHQGCLLEGACLRA